MESNLVDALWDSVGALFGGRYHGENEAAERLPPTVELRRVCGGGQTGGIGDGEGDPGLRFGREWGDMALDAGQAGAFAGAQCLDHSFFGTPDGVDVKVTKMVRRGQAAADQFLFFGGEEGGGKVIVARGDPFQIGANGTFVTFHDGA